MPRDLRPDPEWTTMPLRRIPTQARSRDKLARALDAAEELVRTEGVDAINLPRVADAAGVSVGALYQYLPDREAITAALVHRYHARLERLLDEAIARAAAAPHPADPVASVIHDVARVYREEAATRALHSATPSAEAQRRRQEHKRRMAQRVESLLRAAGLLGETDPERAHVVAQVAFASADAVMHDAFDAPPAEREALLAELTRALRTSLS